MHAVPNLLRKPTHTILAATFDVCLLILSSVFKGTENEVLKA